MLEKNKFFIKTFILVGLLLGLYIFLPSDAHASVNESSLVFDDDIEATAYYDAGDAPNLDIKTSEYTFMFWVNVTEGPVSGDYDTFYGKWATSTNDMEYKLEYKNWLGNHSIFYCSSDDGSTEHCTYWSQELTEGNWYHVAVTQAPRATDKVSLWINGDSQGARTGHATNYYPASTTNFYIGSQNDEDQYFDGKIDEFKHYEHVLTETEIEDIMFQEIATNPYLNFYNQFDYDMSDEEGDYELVGINTYYSVDVPFDGTRDIFAHKLFAGSNDDLANQNPAWFWFTLMIYLFPVIIFIMTIFYVLKFLTLSGWRSRI